MEKSNRYFRDTVALVDFDAIAHNVNHFVAVCPTIAG